MSMTFAQKAELSLHYIKTFNNYAGRGVLGGDPNDRNAHTYAINNPFNPDAQSWQGSATAPIAIARMADELTTALKGGVEVENLGQARFYFRQVADHLPVSALYADKDPCFQKTVTEGITAAVPAVKAVLAEIDRQLEATPL